MKYEVLAGNRVRKKLDKPEPKISDYNIEHMTFDQEYQEFITAHDLWYAELQDQPIYPISGSHNWKEGQLIEEYKDFQLWSRCLKRNECLCSDLQSTRCSNVGWVVEPIPSSVTNEEDELWKEVVDELTEIIDLENSIMHLKQLFTISRKPSSSSLHS